MRSRAPPCVLYTSDDADEDDSVDIGGGRINKKTKRYTINVRNISFCVYTAKLVTLAWLIDLNYYP